MIKTNNLLFILLYSSLLRTCQDINEKQLMPDFGKGRSSAGSNDIDIRQLVQIKRTENEIQESKLLFTSETESVSGHTLDYYTPKILSLTTVFDTITGIKNRVVCGVKNEIAFKKFFDTQTEEQITFHGKTQSLIDWIIHAKNNQSDDFNTVSLFYYQHNKKQLATISNLTGEHVLQILKKNYAYCDNNKETILIVGTNDKTLIKELINDHA